MEIQEMSIDAVKPYWNNARDNEKTIEPLCKSIRDYGFNQPIVVDREMTVIVGHARLKAARKLGMATVPVVITDLSPDKAKKYRIADNKIQERTEWVEDRLFKELAEIGDRAELLDMGFALADINKILAEETPALQAAVESVVMAEAVPAVPVSGVPDKAPERVLTAVPIQEDEPSKEEIERQLKQREAELKGRFVADSYMSHSHDNDIICPYCGKAFMIKRAK